MSPEMAEWLEPDVQKRRRPVTLGPEMF
jgi:hypothetical protein